MNFFDHKDLGNDLLQLCPKVVKHPVCKYANPPTSFKKDEDQGVVKKNCVAYCVWKSKKSRTVGEGHNLQGSENRARRKISDSKKHKASNLKYYVRRKR